MAATRWLGRELDLGADVSLVACEIAGRPSAPARPDTGMLQQRCRSLEIV
jgi:hypothetical protein